MNFNARIKDNILRNMKGVRYAEDEKCLEHNLARAKGYFGALYDAELMDGYEWGRIEDVLLNAHYYRYYEIEYYRKQSQND